MEDENTIFFVLFLKYLEVRFILKQTENMMTKLIADIEMAFFLLVDQCDHYGFNTNLILEHAHSSGITVFSITSSCSERISALILNRDIMINSIDAKMVTPLYRYPKLVVPMLKKNLNPKVIEYCGAGNLDAFKTNFATKKASELLNTFPRSIHYSLEDIECKVGCQVQCDSKFKKYFFKNGLLLKMNDKNRIGKGGFGLVFKQKFHGEMMAMKCVPIATITKRDYIEEQVSDLEKNIAEYRQQLVSKGVGIVLPTAIIRQQNQENDENGKWVAINHNIYVYPLFDLNLYEFHDQFHHRFTDKILKNLIYQCLTRKFLIKYRNQKEINYFVQKSIVSKP